MITEDGSNEQRTPATALGVTNLKPCFFNFRPAQCMPSIKRSQRFWRIPLLCVFNDNRLSQADRLIMKLLSKPIEIVVKPGMQ